MEHRDPKHGHVERTPHSAWSSLMGEAVESEVPLCGLFLAGLQ